MKTFFSRIFSTFYNPAFYAEARKGGLKRPILTSLFLGAFGAALLMLNLYAHVVPFASSDMVSRIEALYPDDLEITLAAGEVSINQPEPYYIKNTIVPERDAPANLVIFDTIDSLKGGAADNKTFLLVKKTYLIAAQNDNDERITRFDAAMGTSTFSKADVKRFADKIRPYVKPAILFGGLVVAGFGTIFSAMLWLGFHLLYLLFPGVLVYLFGRFREPQMGWKESYIVAVYASIPVAILSFVISFAGWPLPIFMYTLLVMLVALVNLTQVPNEVPAEHLDAPQPQ